MALVALEAVKEVEVGELPRPVLFELVLLGSLGPPEPLVTTVTLTSSGSTPSYMAAKLNLKPLMLKAVGSPASVRATLITDW